MVSGALLLLYTSFVSFCQTIHGSFLYILPRTWIVQSASLASLASNVVCRKEVLIDTSSLNDKIHDVNPGLINHSLCTIGGTPQLL